MGEYGRLGFHLTTIIPILPNNLALSMQFILFINIVFCVIVLSGKLGHRCWARIRENARQEVGGGPHFILRETRYMSLYFQMALQGLQPQNQEPRFRIQVLVCSM
jgi:hypothetical protein